MLRTYRGSCHCEAVKFEADLDLTQSSYRCNCSICRRNRFWPEVAAPDCFRLLAGEAELTEYRFSTRKNVHFFCRRCGVRPFGVETETPIGTMYGVNIGCLEGVTEEELSPHSCHIRRWSQRQACSAGALLSFVSDSKAATVQPNLSIERTFQSRFVPFGLPLLSDVRSYDES